jgi:phosphohistidine phosphatase
MVFFMTFSKENWGLRYNRWQDTPGRGVRRVAPLLVGGAAGVRKWPESGRRSRPHEGVSVQLGLAPNDDVRPLADTVAGQSGSVMLVGHLPFLSRLVSFLLVGDCERPLVQFRNGGLVGLARDGDNWAISCVIPPGLIGRE